MASRHGGRPRSVAPTRTGPPAWARAAGAALLALSLAGTAAAVLPPWVYRDARDKAMFHLQVKVLAVAVPEATPGQCGVTGRYLEVFLNRDGARYEVALWQSCIIERPTERSTWPPERH